jgi:hypothetical protein
MNYKYDSARNDTIPFASALLLQCEPDLQTKMERYSALSGRGSDGEACTTIRRAGYRFSGASWWRPRVLPASRRQSVRSRIVSFCRQDAGSLEFGHLTRLGRREANGLNHTSPGQRPTGIELSKLRQDRSADFSPLPAVLAGPERGGLKSALLNSMAVGQRPGNARATPWEKATDIH